MNKKESEKSPGLSRARLVSAALTLIQDEGLEALSMRSLADRLNVKAASLYWHVRDRRELVELLADSILATVPATHRPAGWRQAVLDAGLALSSRVAAQKDADRILLEVPDALERSGTYGDLKLQLQAAGLQPAEAGQVALAAMVQVITARKRPAPSVLGDDAAAWIAIDSGSRGVVVHAGFDMDSLIRVATDQGAAAPSAVVHGETVVVRRLRGVGLGEIELNPRNPWRFKVHGATWNTVLDASGVDVREIKVDSGAAKVECFLPPPRGIVPIDISSGVVGVALHRAPGVAVIADCHSGALRLKLDDYSIPAVINDIHWESEGATKAADRYELRINSGVVQLTLDTQVSPSRPSGERVGERGVQETNPTTQPASALEILLDGVEVRVRRG
ncbi:MAG TPA: TetR family transcriptional regulator [Candidatus Eisenbacteria bacterium]|nr:TetR family transcriptional regulator [Candidatus Eisenbacteria bacterium]